MYEAFCDLCYVSFFGTDEALNQPFFSAPHAICPHCGSICTQLVDDYEKPGVGMLEYEEETDLLEYEQETDLESEPDSEPGPDESDGDSGGEEAEK